MAQPTTSQGRRSPEESRQLIIAGARLALGDVGMGGLTVGTVMERTPLGRSSFYVHFKDLDELTLCLLEENVALFAVPSQVWFEDPRAETMAQALEQILVVWSENRGWWGELISAAVAPRKQVGRDWRATEVDNWAPLIASLIPEDGPAVRAGATRMGVARSFVLLLFSTLAEHSVSESVDLDALTTEVTAVGTALLYGVPEPGRAQVRRPPRLQATAADPR